MPGGQIFVAKYWHTTVGSHQESERETEKSNNKHSEFSLSGKKRIAAFDNGKRWKKTSRDPINRSETVDDGLGNENP